MSLHQRRNLENLTINCLFKAGGVLWEGVWEAGANWARRWGSGRDWSNLCAQPFHILCPGAPASKPQHQARGTNSSSSCPVQGPSRNPRHPVAFSPPLLRAADQFTVDRLEGKCANVYGTEMPSNRGPQPLGPVTTGTRTGSWPIRNQAAQQEILDVITSATGIFQIT
uniref:Uncharacterized protein n=1 Tax=Rousettus aegyptiacus TaxID=9407 RepID=A0A7J8KAZ4_ROUAE|nr:hypothetical protein HJG63_007867 [Rousettus aegyptiacus]